MKKKVVTPVWRHEGSTTLNPSEGTGEVNVDWQLWEQELLGPSVNTFLGDSGQWLKMGSVVLRSGEFPQRGCRAVRCGPGRHRAYCV